MPLDGQGTTESIIGCTITVIRIQLLDEYCEITLAVYPSTKCFCISLLGRRSTLRIISLIVTSCNLQQSKYLYDSYRNVTILLCQSVIQLL